MAQDDEGKRQLTIVRPRAAGSIEAPAGTSLAANRRASSRVETTHNASVKLSNVSYSVEVCDVSRTGAQICIRQGLMPEVGQVVTLQFMNQVVAEASVIWTKGSFVGLEFAEMLADSFDVVHFDDLGSDFYRAVLKLQTGGQ
jgi:hypothetical protein